MVVAEHLAADAFGGFFSVIFRQYKNVVIFVIIPKLSRMKKSPNLISLSEQKMLMMITSLQLMKIQVCHTYMVSKRTLF